MKIAILSRYQKTIARGAESFVTELSTELKKNHEVVVLSGKDADSLLKIISGKFDVVIAMNGRFQVLKASIGRIFSHYKLVTTGQSGIGRDDIFSISFARPDLFVALTDYMKSWALNWGKGVKIVKIPNGVDLKKFAPNGPKARIGLKKPVIVSVGALVWYKHHERTIEAMTHVPDGSLLIVGRGEKEEELTKLGKEKLGDRFQIISVPFEQIPEIYRSCDLFVLPSWEREAFGIVYIEALASGLPVVAPDDSPRKEIIGDAGIFVDVTNPEEYAKGIKDALSKFWDDLPRKQSEKFSWEKIGARYEEELLKLVQK